MKFDVLLADDAERDIGDIYSYVALYDAPEKAERLLVALERACDSLADFPTRCHIPKELEPLGITEYREIEYKPYRVIYRIEEKRVIVYCVLDGRRDMQSLLQRRLVR